MEKVKGQKNPHFEGITDFEELLRTSGKFSRTRSSRFFLTSES